MKINITGLTDKDENYFITYQIPPSKEKEFLDTIKKLFEESGKDMFTFGQIEENDPQDTRI